MEQWRLMLDPAYDGPTNMAIDEAILESVGRGDAPPTLRLFRWEPACLSLGYAQAVSEMDSQRMSARGWEVVRRMTGGRAILHTDELTYSITLPIEHTLVTGTIPESYRRLSAALLVAVERLGLDAHADRYTKSKGVPLGPVCFEVPSDYEITANGKKLVGSAQVRRHNGALQHGTLPLHGDVGRICDALLYPDEASRQQAREKVHRRATTLHEALGRSVSWEEAAQAVSAAFADTFSVQLEPSPLCEEERQRADELRASRYQYAEWTLKAES